MDAIKKKMQGMKLEKDNAMDRALLCEQQARDANARAEKVQILHKKIILFLFFIKTNIHQYKQNAFLKYSNLKRKIVN